MIHIFYVEDEPFLAKIVKETLESNDYLVTLVADGDRALGRFDPEVHDICVLDIMLPNKNGFDIAKDIRRIHHEIPIIFLTAKDQTKDILKGFDVGGNDYIKKPFSIEELIVRIENLLRITGNSTANNNPKDSIRIGQKFLFKPILMELQHEHTKRTLSHRESQILELLCKNTTQPAQRKNILMQVWGDDSFSNSRNLDVYITKLRSYFKSDPTIKILTLKGVGYQFLVDNE